MIKCATCGAEMQNPFNYYGETAVNWLSIHTNSPHKITYDTELEKQLLADIKVIYIRYHDKFGVRLIK